MPCRSIAFETRFARCVNTRFMREEKVVVCLMHASFAGAAAVTYLTGVAGDLRLLPLRDSPQRRAALALEPGAAARYALYGMDELAARGWAVRSQPRLGGAGSAAGVAGAAMKRGVEATGELGGDFATVLASLRGGESADVILWTDDTRRNPADAPGARARRPHSVRLRRDRAAGAPRATSLTSRRGRDTRRRSGRRPGWSRTASTKLSRCDGGCGSAARTCLSRSSRLRHQHRCVRPCGARGRRRPRQTAPHRGFELLLSVAGSLSDARFVVVTTAEHARSLGERPPNVSVETEPHFDTDARPAGAGAGRRAGGSRQQLLNATTHCPSGDGASRSPSS